MIHRAHASGVVDPKPIRTRKRPHFRPAFAILHARSVNDLSASVVAPRSFVLVRGAWRRAGACSLKTCCVPGAPARKDPDAFRATSRSEPCRESDSPPIAGGPDASIPAFRPCLQSGRHVVGRAGPLTSSTGVWEAIGSPEVPWPMFAVGLRRFPLRCGRRSDGGKRGGKRSQSAADASALLRSAVPSPHRRRPHHSPSRCQ
jgi:hypothetical protein